MDTLKKRLLTALHESKGNVFIACINANVSRSTFYNYFNQDTEFKQQVSEINESAIDHVESKLMQKIDEGETVAIIFYLKTKGRKRGYAEKLTIEETAPKKKPDWLL
jgi:hypothetical protein